MSHYRFCFFFGNIIGFIILNSMSHYLIRREKRMTEFHRMTEEFHPQQTQLAQLPSF